MPEPQDPRAELGKIDAALAAIEKAALRQFFDALGSAALCGFNYALYTPPDDNEIIRQLSGETE